MVAIYDVLKASKGIHVDDTFAELWGRKRSNAYTVATYTGTLPATLKNVEGYLESYKIYGNTVQNGTPTPENPIMPSGCGERTENLFDVNANNPDNGYAYGKQVTLDGSVVTFPQANVSEYISITPFSLYTFTYGSQYNDVYAALYNAKREFVRSIRYNGKKEITFYSQEDENYLRFTYLRARGNTVMLNTGSTALPYEPYGYKLPLAVNGVEYPIYLGDAQLAKDEYVDSETGKIYHNVGGELTPIDPPAPFPRIPTVAGTTIIDYDGTPKPEKVELTYRKRKGQ